MPEPEIDLLLTLLDQSYQRKAWHGPNLKGSLRGVTAEEAAWRPGPGRHNVWELAVHAAYWKYAVLRRLRDLPRGSFPLEGSNFFARPEGDLSEKAWKKDLALLADIHRQLREAVGELRTWDLGQIRPPGKTSLRDLILGVASHDVYHAGQIQLIKRLRQGSSGTQDRS